MLLPKRHKVGFLLISALALAACTNSEWFLSVIYNRADSEISEEVLEYAEYTDQQEQQINEIIDRFHLWHRVTQLPQYADLLETVSARMRSGSLLDPAEVSDWYDQIERLVDQTGLCHPMLYGMDIMRSLSDEQIGQIAEHMQDQYDRYMERNERRTSEERMERRHRNRTRWLNRFDLDPTAGEIDSLMAMLEQQPNMREANFELWQQWDRGLIELLNVRNTPDFDDRMRAHVLSLGTLTEENYPEMISASRSLWIEYLLGLLNTRIDAGDYGFADWADKMALNLRAIAGKIPEDQLDWEPADYCPESNWNR